MTAKEGTRNVEVLVPIYNVKPGFKLVAVSIDTAQWLLSQGRRVMGVARRSGVTWLVEVPQ